MKFSIIIPTHNGADRITRCLESVKNQVFDDYELIVVCDNCTDQTPVIAGLYADKIFNVNFKSAGLARNIGLDNAVGDYVLFLDDDDYWLHEYVLKQIADKLTDEDVLCFSFIFKGVGYAVPLGNCGGTEHWVAVWNKCWKRSFIDNVRFSNKTTGEDTDFHWAMMSKKPKIVNWDMPIYYYNYMRPGSLSYNKIFRKGK